MTTLLGTKLTRVSFNSSIVKILRSLDQDGQWDTRALSRFVFIVHCRPIGDYGFSVSSSFLFARRHTVLKCVTPSPPKNWRTRISEACRWIFLFLGFNESSSKFKGVHRREFQNSMSTPLNAIFNILFLIPEKVV